MSDPNLFDSVGLDKVSLAGSFFGALISLKWVDASLPRTTRLLMVIGGFLVSVFVTPALVEWFGLTGRVVGGLAFMLGIVGMSFVDAVAIWVKSGKIGEMLDRAKGKAGL